MEFGWNNEAERFRDSLRAFIQAEVPASVSKLVPGEDPYSTDSLAFCGKLAERGWMVPHWPREHGGSDASPWLFTILTEELWKAGEPRGSQYMNVNWIGPAIIAAGTDAQKRQHLSRISRGEVLWCQGFSEEEAGSDLANLQTSARRDGDDYVIAGHKIWTSYASKAEYCFLLAREPAGGITVFLVPMATAGIRVERIRSVLGIHEVHRLTFDEVRVPSSCRLGEEGQGWALVRNALSDERVGTPRYARAGLLLDQLVELCREHGRFGDLGLRRQAVLAQAACESARLLSYRVRQARANGVAAGPEAYIGRAAIVRAERSVSEFALEVLGQSALVAGSLGDGEFRTAMIAGLGGGSYEMQLNLIARLWLSLPK